MVATITEAWGAPFSTATSRPPPPPPPLGPRPRAGARDDGRRAARRYVEILYARRGVPGVLAFLGRRIAHAIRRELRPRQGGWGSDWLRELSSERLLFAMLCCLAALLLLDTMRR